MQTIPLALVRMWATVNNTKVPKTVSTICPHCGERGNFFPADPQDDVPRLTVSATAACPACNRRVHFWTIRRKEGTSYEPIAIYMYPVSANYYPLPEFSPNVPEPLKRAFGSTIDSLNTKNYTATATGARRTLEGIFKRVAPDDAKRSHNLAQLIDQATSNIDLARPPRTLAHGIRGGGNLGAHFEPTTSPPTCSRVKWWSCSTT